MGIDSWQATALIALAQTRKEKAKDALREAQDDLTDIYRRVLDEHFLNSGHKVAVGYLVVPETWECSESPVGMCVYNEFEDQDHDGCLFCKKPEGNLNDNSEDHNRHG